MKHRLNKLMKVLNSLHFKLIVCFMGFGIIPMVLGVKGALGISVGVVVIIGAAFLIAARLTFPLKKLSDDVNSLSEGHRDVELSVNGSSEIWDIQESINGLLREMAAIDARRDEFVSNVSHELKTPMASMKILSDSLLSSPDAPKEMYIEFLNDINSQIDRENKIISNLLTLVKMTEGENGPVVALVTINDLVEKIMRDLKPLAVQRNIEMVFESYRNVIAEVDEVKLSLVVTNLVENAIKYNKDSGKVMVTLNADHRFMELKVEDSGIGVPKEAQKRIFDRFYRVDKARSRETGGTGLGLSIVKEIVLMHRGNIKVYDSKLGGTAFAVRIPLIYNQKNK